MSESKFQRQVIKEYEAKGYYVIKLVAPIRTVLWTYWH